MSTKKANIITIAEFIINSITATALFFLLVSTLSMVEKWKMSGVALATFIICFAWLGIIGTYKKIVIR